MSDASRVLLLLGGNLGDPPRMLDAAQRMITERVGAVLGRSRDHWTEPWGFADERVFLNRALLVETEHEPSSLLRSLLAIENELGRERNTAQRYAARTIDIDILLIGDRVIDSDGLQVPHPRMHERAFALAPAADIVPSWVHPTLHHTVLDLLNDLRERR
ncbi:MAG: 2-amino-4-hydroxy-6-hydroxymethyldihydropteridine diphosphokinase [Flavobacteriales bacterium]|nr:2-amino-4-hydroxy-6-hydroxymethyldihydropteridine diphosphokinase [Flavobacteriales bacterium]